MDKIPRVTPLRFTGLKMLIGKQVCAVVYDSNISINYNPLNGNLQGANLGTVAFEVRSVTPLAGFSTGTLPEVEIRILSVKQVTTRTPGCADIHLQLGFPEPTSSSEPYDTGRN